MSKPTLGVAMISLNEEIHMSATIPQFYNVADDLVLVDGGSSDKTVEWAQKLGARVEHVPFEGDFSKQKNNAISFLETDWIYVHDPDERLEPTLIEIIPLLIDALEGQQSLMSAQVIPATGQPLDCFGIPRRNYIDGIQTTIYPDYQYRLFRNYCRYEKPVHEEIIGFKNRTEVDFLRKTINNPSRFNILHYKSSDKQKQQNDYYLTLEKGNN